MDIREVEKTIKRCLGGTFTGKVAVRIVRGEIIACDVGEAGTGMPPISHTEMMRRVVNMPQEVAKPPEVIDAEAAVADARAAWERAQDGYFDALVSQRSAERSASAGATASPTSSSQPTYDSRGRLDTPELRAARERVEQAEQEMNRRSDALSAATVRATEITRRWHSEKRFADRKAPRDSTGQVAAAS